VSASVLDMSMSLDGYIADPDDFLGGDDGERLHKWADADGESRPARQYIRYASAAERDDDALAHRGDGIREPTLAAASVARTTASAATASIAPGRPTASAQTPTYAGPARKPR